MAEQSLETKQTAGAPARKPGAAGIPLRVLVVEDSEDAALMVVQVLKRGGFDVTHETVDTAEAMRAALAGGAWNLIVSDHSMPAFDALAALEVRRDCAADVPFIIVSGVIGEEVAVEAMRLGASDYVMKDKLARLVPAVKRELSDAKARRDRRRAMEALHASEERFRSLTALSSDWYWEQDEEYRFLDLGSDSASKPHVRRPEFVGKKRWDNPSANLTAEQWAEHRAHLEARQPFHDFEYCRLGIDGERRWVSISGEPVFDADGKFRGYRGVGKDINDRKRAEHESERLRRAMDLSADSIYLTDAASLRFIYVNDSGCRRLGYSREQLLRLGPHDVLPKSEGEIRQEFAAVISAGERGMRVESGFVRSDQSEGWTEIHRRAVETDTGWLIVTIGRDITERRLAEMRIKRLNRVYAVMSGINSLIARVRDRDELFREACRIAVSAGGFAVARIIERGEDGKAWIAATTDEEDPAAFEEVVSAYNRDPAGADSLLAQALRSGEPMVSNNIGPDPRVLSRAVLNERGTHALALLPLRAGARHVGTLALRAHEAGMFDAEEMKLLTELAGDISFALEHIEKAKQLDYLALYDSLTGLANRTLFLERLNQSIHAAAQIEEGKFAVILADVERLRTVNESLGRQAGDALLRQLAERFVRVAGRSEVGRVTADQFVMVVPTVKGRSEAGRVVQTMIRASFSAPFHVNGTELRVSAKTGIALFPHDGTDAETLIKHAEAALRDGKKTGEPCTFFRKSLADRSAASLTLENKLRMALEKDEYVLHYQPKVDLETRRIVGVEALIRWQSPELGLVPPVKFIPLLEETGLILDVGSWALRQAAKDHRLWSEAGIRPPKIAVNVSPIQLRRKEFVSMVEQAVMEGVAPTGIDLEITESLIMEDIEGNILKLKEVRALGVDIAIDDFGTGYSSLAYLAKLPVQTLKIDRSFVITMLEDADTMALVQTIISLAHSLRLKVVAEGVEEERQAKVLRLLRCDQMQGYLFSKPLPVAELTKLLLQPA